MADPDFSAFPLVPKGRQFEDFEVGEALEHHWGRTLGEADATLFSTLAPVEDLSEAGGPFLGVNGVEFHRPVHPGDTLDARSTVISTRGSEKRPQFGVVTWRTEGHNQNGELVLSYERTNLIRRKSRSERKRP
jgi:acyl dehydratase